MKKKFKYLLILFIFPILLAALFLRNVIFKQASASWFDESWHYRKAVQITNPSGSNLTDFQVNISIGTSALIAAGKMQSDCDDLRVTDANGKVLPHWIEENNPGCNSASGDTKVWVKAPSLPTSGATLYVYYGNPSASRAEKPDSIFDTNIAQAWEFDSGLDGWVDVTRLTQPVWQNNALTTSITELDPYMRSNDGLGINASSSKYVLIKMKETAGNTNAEFFWITNLDTTWDQEKKVNYLLTYSGDWQYLVFDLSNDLDWANTVTRIRFDPTILNTSGNVEIDWIRVLNTGSSIPASTLGSEEVSKAPIAYWKFDEGTGDTAHDSSGQNNHGILTNNPTWTNEESCISGKCLQFNGDNTYLNITNSGNLNFGGKNFTISMWLKNQWDGSVGTNSLIGTGNPYNDNGKGWILSQKDLNTLVLRTRRTPDNLYDRIWNVTIPDNWSLITLVINYDQGIASFYINGNFIGNNSISLIQTDFGTNPIIIGNYGRSPGNNRGFNGLIDEVKIYPYARSEKEIKADYNAGLAGIGTPKGAAAALGKKAEQKLTDGLVAYYKFDEGYGSYANNSGFGGNALKGTLGSGSSAPTWSNNGKFGKALSFADTQYVDLPSILTNATQVTISAWVNPSSTTYIFQHGSSNSHSGYINYFRVNANGSLETDISDITPAHFKPISPSGIVTLNQWNYVAMVIGETSVNWYVNGKLVETNGFAGMRELHASLSGYRNIGRYYYSTTSVYYSSGLIDEVKIYNYALTEEEIKIDYNQGAALQLGSKSVNTGNTSPATASSQQYCVPGDTAYCAPPAAEWNFNENTGGTANDTSSNNTGTLGTGSSAPNWSVGPDGSPALKFDGNDYITAGTAPSLNITGAITVEAWVKPTSASSTPRIISKKSGNSGFLLSPHNNKPRLLVGNGTSLSTVTSNVTMSVDSWYHLAGTFDGSNSLKIYVNGVETGSATANSLASTPNTPLTIGADPIEFNYPWDGLIDGVKIYNYVRTPAQIVWDYNKGAPIAHWKFNECQGNTLHDSSDNNLHGTINIGVGGTQTSAGTCTDGSANSAWSNGKDGKYGASLNFDGQDDNVLIQDNNALDGHSSMSVFLWAKPATSEVKEIIIKHLNTTSDINWELYQNSGNISGRINGTTGTCTSTGSLFTTNIWHQVGMVWTGTQTNIYIDGILNQTCDRNTTLSNSVGNLSIGGYESKQYTFNGQIDDVKIFNYALTATQVKQLYNENSAVRFGE
jgi:hypothetical protein